MDNWLALFDGQTRYFLDINDSQVKPDVLRFSGREALSEPFKWDIEFTTPQGNIVPEDVLMKYASVRLKSRALKSTAPCLPALRAGRRMSFTRIWMSRGATG
ncbi:TPA: hypothetical protein ACJIWU_004548 [Enterobacter chengduensis]|uniref:Uncharacterized protein n=1 Tax=Enterobacter chengduensis TaxID=2494701 RepID=A0AAW3HBR3_9ENTR|nr:MULTISPECIES: hypothetical protein [Enterobacter cloacae complex]KDF38786.1 hypothetical protein AE07_04662 [Enterobacter cloacae BWH 43]GJL43234.1 hypothetical protein TUM17577_44430 [Enterobacter asburiae]KJX30647.1 hypothetical protein SG71_21555 [Enterobacter chengduensis]MCG0457875.1 hypothetical protein [Enterobacter cloacae complex sp. ECC445]MCK1099524.1 hypothetical protein [Enterobacter chengduensis]